MGGTGGKGLASACGGADFQDGGQNANIGTKYYKEISKEMQEARAQQGSKTCSHIRAGQRVERRQQVFSFNLACTWRNIIIISICRDTANIKKGNN